MNDREIAEILSKYKKIAVVGLSPNRARPSHGVTRAMIAWGYEIVGVNPGHSRILDRPCYRSLLEVPGELEIVDVFRNPSHVPEIVSDAVARKAKVLWLQEGVVHPKAEEQARKAGIQVVSDLCIYKERARLLGDD